MRITAMSGLVLVVSLAAPVVATPAEGPSFLGEAVAVLAAVSAPILDMWSADVQRLWIVAIGALAALFALFVALPGRRIGVGTVLRAVDRWLYS